MPLVPSANSNMNQHRYILEPYQGRNTRYHCPECDKAGTFSHYIDATTGEHLHSSVGRCNREIRCGYHYTPKQYFQDNGIARENKLPIGHKSPVAAIKPKPNSYIEKEVLLSTLKGYEHNNLFEYLKNILGPETATKLIDRYHVGTSKHWPGATVFWQLDLHGKIRTGKIMLYDAATGKRVREPYNHIQWVHSVLERPNYTLNQCLFGEHLLKAPATPVAIVESEKTAIIASAYLPKFVWLAAGGISNLNPLKCSVLKGRDVTLFPDMGGFEKWAKKVNELSHITRIRISDLLEDFGTQEEKERGLDLADYLVKWPVKEFE